jgi:hypothetical protein
VKIGTAAMIETGAERMGRSAALVPTVRAKRAIAARSNLFKMALSFCKRIGSEILQLGYDFFVSNRVNPENWI